MNLADPHAARVDSLFAQYDRADTTSAMTRGGGLKASDFPPVRGAEHGAGAPRIDDRFSSLLNTNPRGTMPIRDEKTFTDEEFIAAFSIILPPDEARREGLVWNAFPDPKGFEAATPEELRVSEFKSHRSYDGDLLDLLSLVSDSCAERAWLLMGISHDEGERRRAEFRRRIEEAVRARDSSAS